MDIIRARLRQGYRTIRFPRKAPPALPDRFRGLPRLDASACAEGCRECAAACPVGAIAIHGAERGRGLTVDLGRCMFCADCVESCPTGAIAFTGDYRLSVRARDDLVTDGSLRLADAIARKLRRLLGRSLRLRQLSAGGCNACEADSNVLTTVGWDIGRFGIAFVASPRHADGLLVTGPVTRNMRGALEKTYEAVPSPKLVIAVGACAISGGLYARSPETCGGVAGILPVDLFVPGCPPHPLTLLDGLLRLLGRLE